MVRFRYHVIFVLKVWIFDHCRGPSQGWEKVPVGPDGLARESNYLLGTRFGWLAGSFVARWQVTWRPSGAYRVYISGSGGS